MADVSPAAPFPKYTRFLVLHELMMESASNDSKNIERMWCCSFFDERALSWKTIKIPRRIETADGASLSAVRVYYMYKLTLQYKLTMYLFYRSPHNGMGNLHYTLYDFQSGKWEEEMHVPDTGVSGDPSLLEYDGKIFCFHQGLDGAFYYNVLNVQTNAWEGEKVMGRADLKPPVALCATKFNGNMFCFQGFKFRYEMFDRREWTAPTDPCPTASAPEFVAVEYGGEIYCIHTGCGNEGGLWYDVFDGMSWVGDQKVPLPEGAVVKGVCAVVERNCLYCFYRRGDRHNSIWFNVLDAWLGNEEHDVWLGNEELRMPFSISFAHVDSKLTVVAGEYH